jgi:hypothetical protein
MPALWFVRYAVLIYGAWVSVEALQCCVQPRRLSMRLGVYLGP